MALLLYLIFLNALIIPYSVQANGITDPTPGLSFRPTPAMLGHNESTLIWFQRTTYDKYKDWVDDIDFFLTEYRNPDLLPAHAENIIFCNYDQPPPPGKVCNVEGFNRGPCVRENYYGYHKGTPCIFLKLNEVSGWMPDFYNDSNALPTQIPQDLKYHIKRLEMIDQKYMDTVWVSCEGENPADVENIGPIQYFPGRGFPGYYFPYMGTAGYLAPLVAVYFERPIIGVIINIECKAWASNIIHNQTENRGSVHLELLID